MLMVPLMPLPGAVPTSKGWKRLYKWQGYVIHDVLPVRRLKDTLLRRAKGKQIHRSCDLVNNDYLLLLLLM